MNRFFRELARHFPRDSGGAYTRRMNWGEYVHFTSGAAAADMSGQAARAFGWPREWADQLERPRAVPRHHVLKYRAVANRATSLGNGPRAALRITASAAPSAKVHYRQTIPFPCGLAVSAACCRVRRGRGANSAWIPLCASAPTGVTGARQAKMADLPVPWSCQDLDAGQAWGYAK
jgi:hypothetical protein